ncbi:MAG: vitamin B12-dependent ribonucleotide reductase [Desulfomonile tiedjei]|nr:vitamin B12-dependent ribonucleotide reductase [Desulfomonile tiedjei]
MARRLKSVNSPTAKRRATTSRASAEALTFRRFFSTAGQDPLEGVEWSERSATIRDATGKVIFEQHNIEAPSSWSDMALNVVASRYFRGKVGTPERENSVRHLICRVTDTILEWGKEQGYFATDEDAAVFRDELVYLIVHQIASFNSPVWFNVGVEPNPQCSACFILSVDDSMGSILEWYRQEGMIFKGGSGAGINVSRLRSLRERLSGGGTASGPVSFMKAADSLAGVIKSGGKTRRAAKMAILDAEHPDVFEFIRSKATEESKAQALVRAGYDDSFEGPAYNTVAFQNSNHSVRVTDEFMEADQKDEEWKTRLVVTGEPADTFRARDVMREIALAAHACGDPGIQFHTTINGWHTCPETSPIRASNPCSEYMHVDDSACNLASVRLSAFLDESDRFQVGAFQHAVDVMITAQDVLVDKASYPTPAITRNSHRLRALGLGFADLGSLIMRLGLAYDSDAGRSWGAAIASLMTAEAYAQSARIARGRGAFAEFERNRTAMLRVIQRHRDNNDRIDSSLVPGEVVSAAIKAWEHALELGERFGYANCQTTVLAPTGTVAFMMDCDTTGIEPELALVKYKALVGGGQLKLVNRAVGPALEKLGYTPSEIQLILQKIEETGTIEGIEEIKPEHQSVFDCAFRPLRGKRYISTQGHLLMMASVQPFISGAISKTVNLRRDTTVAEIEEIFRLAWKLGLKSISVYRDGCKGFQPLVLSSREIGTTARPVRHRLPVDCKSARHKFEIAGQKGYIHTGFYEDGKVGEIFISVSKEGSTISGLMDTIATLTSIALQYGVPLEVLVNKFSHVRFEPSGFTSNPDVPFAKSLTDYIFRYLGTRFLTREQQESAGLLAARDAGEQTQQGAAGAAGSRTQILTGGVFGHAFQPQSDAPPCQDCGAITVRSGSCYKCLNCGATYGCS